MISGSIDERGERVIFRESERAAQRALHPEDAGLLHARQFAKGGAAVREIVVTQLRLRLGNDRRKNAHFYVAGAELFRGEA